MRDSDALDNNPHISRSELESIHGPVFGWALSRCDFDRIMAEDLVQQVYVELLTGRARFDNESSLKTFVCAVVQNLASNHFRRLRSRLRLRRRYLRLATDERPGIHEPHDARRIWRAVRQLPARQRDIIELVFCRDLTIEEASTVMGVATGTGRTHYERAKKTLKATLGDHGEQ